MDKIEIVDATPNQILVFDEISGKFVNRDAGDVIRYSGLSGGENMTTDGVPIFKDVIDNNARFRTIKGGDQIRVRNMHSYVEIEFSGDANSLRGKVPTDFLAVENDLSEINPTNARLHLDVYNKREARDMFMETNASNMPDRDNTYDLGSNGNRYADIYAVTFNGTATRALFAEALHPMNANQGDLLSWSDADNSWKPQKPKTIRFSDIDQVTSKSPKDGDILQYNRDKGEWEYVEYVPYEAANDGSIVALNSTGSGVSVIRSRVGDIIELRSLRAGSNIEIEPVRFNNEISIRAIVPETTDDLPEGNENLYYTEDRVIEVIKDTPLYYHSDVTNTTPQNGQGLISINGEWLNKDIPYELYTTDELPEGENNLYYTESRVVSVIHGQRDSGFMSLDDLSNTNPNNEAGTYLYYNGLNWVNREIESGDIIETTNLFYTVERVQNVVTQMFADDKFGMNDLNDITTNASTAREVLTYDGTVWVNDFVKTEDIIETTNLFHTVERVQDIVTQMFNDETFSIDTLSDVAVTTASNREVLIHNGTQWVNDVVKTEDITESTSNLFFTEARTQTVVNDMLSSGSMSLNDFTEFETTGSSDGEVLMYSGGTWTNTPIELDFPLFQNYRTKSVASTTVIDFEASNVHRIDGTLDATLTLQGTAPSTEAINVVICIEGYGGIITWPSSVSWNNDTEPTMGPNWTNIILFWTGVRWVGMLSARG